MTNLLEQAIGRDDDGDQTTKIIQNAPGIESDDVVNLHLPEAFARRSRAARSHDRLVASRLDAAANDPMV